MPNIAIAKNFSFFKIIEQRPILEMVGCIILSKVKLWVWILREQHFIYRDQRITTIMFQKGFILL